MGAILSILRGENNESQRTVLPLANREFLDIMILKSKKVKVNDFEALC